MKTSERKSTGRKAFWKRNLVVAAIALFVGVAVYLNWNYEQQAGKVLGESTLVGKEDTLLSTDASEDTSGDASAEGSGTDQTQNKDGQTQKQTGDYFATARLNRQQARDSALALLQQAVARDDADETAKAEADAAIQTMANYTVTEAQIENLISAKGYTDCVAFIGEDALSLAVAAPEGGITDADTARILDLVNQAAQFSAEQVKIIEVESQAK